MGRKKLESQFCSELKKSADVLGYWLHKIGDTPRSRDYRFSITKRFDLYLGVNKNNWYAIECKAKGDKNAFAFSSIRDSELSWLKAFLPYGDSYLIINYRVSGKLGAFAIDINTLLALRDKKLKEGKKSLSYQEILTNSIQLGRVKSKKGPIWDLQCLIRKDPLKVAKKSRRK